MRFVRETTKKGYSGQAFDKVGVNSATHVKLKGKNEFIEITSDLIIKQKKDSEGYPVDAIVYYTDINTQSDSKEEYVCIVKDKEVPIDKDFYANIVFMTKNTEGKGNYYRTEDGRNSEGVIKVGRYVHKDEIQVPAYRKLHLPSGHSQQEHNLILDTYWGKHFTYREFVELPSGKKIEVKNQNVIKLSDDKSVRKENGKWFYYEGESKRASCKSSQERIDVEYLLLDGDKVVDISKIKQSKGSYVLESENGNVDIGKYELSLQNPFIEGSTIEPNQEIVIPHNQLKQIPRLDQYNTKLVFKWAEEYPGPNGLLRIEVNGSRSCARFKYKDSKEIVYAEYGVSVKPDPNVVEYRVQKFEIQDLGEQGIKFEFFQKKNAIAQNIEYNGNKATSCTINDRVITDIKWAEVGGMDQIVEYTIDGVNISDVEFEHGKIKKCRVHLTNEEGNPEIHEIGDLSLSRFKHLAITCDPIDKIKDVNVDSNGNISFRMGKYKISEGEYNAEDGTIGKCKIKRDGETEKEIDLSTDERFKQLRLAVKVSLDTERVVPLIQSKLLDKKDGEYKLVADVVQNADFDKYGVASASELKSVEQAANYQSEFKKNPFATVVIDEKGKAHKLTDFTTTYNGISKFEQDNKLVSQMLGKTKLEVVDGKIKIDSSKDDKYIENTAVMGFVLCSNPLTLIFGFAYLTVAAGSAVVLPIMRAAKKVRVQRHQDLDKVTDKIQHQEEETCEQEVNKLIEKYQGKIKRCKKLSDAEFREVAAELKEEFLTEYYSKLGNLQMISAGTMKCKFDMGKKTSLSHENFLAYLAALRKQEELRYGKRDHPDMDKILENFRKQEFLNNDSKILEQVRIYQKYGGVFYQRQAHTTKMLNLDLFLAEENKIRKKNGQKIISKEQYKKDLEREYIQARLEWDSFKGKLEAFKQTEEYINADKKERRKLLDNKRKALEKEIASVKIDEVEFNERLDKNGNPLINKYSRSMEMYLEKEILPMFTTGNTHIKKKFSLDYADKVSKKEEKDFTPTTNLRSVLARKVNSTTCRRLYFDNAINNKKFSEAEEILDKVNKRVERMIESVKDAEKRKDYESALKSYIAVDVKEQELNKDCNEVEKKIEVVPYKNLTNSRSKKMLDNVEQAKVDFRQQKLDAKRVKDEFAEEYKKQVENWANEEFVSRHQKDFDIFVRNSAYRNKDKTLKELIDEFKVEYPRDKQEHFNNELEMLKVKNHIEENIDAEVFCEQNEEEFKKFIEEKNNENTTGTKLELDSEIARCYYYSYWKQKNNNEEVKKFKELSSKKRKAKAQERLENGKLTHQERNKGKEKTVEIGQGQQVVTQPVQSAEPQTQSSAAEEVLAI